MPLGFHNLQFWARRFFSDFFFAVEAGFSSFVEARGFLFFASCFAELSDSSGEIFFLVAHI